VRDRPGSEQIADEEMMFPCLHLAQVESTLHRER
jgi:hypothetical protein